MTLVRWSVQNPEFGQAIRQAMTYSIGGRVCTRWTRNKLLRRSIHMACTDLLGTQRRQTRVCFGANGRVYYPPDVTNATDGTIEQASCWLDLSDRRWDTIIDVGFGHWFPIKMKAETACPEFYLEMR